MRVAAGTVVEGRVMTEDLGLADGTPVYVVSLAGDSIPSLSAEELAELEAGIAEADRGELIAGETLFDELRRFG